MVVESNSNEKNKKNLYKVVNISMRRSVITFSPIIFAFKRFHCVFKTEHGTIFLSLLSKNWNLKIASLYNVMLLVLSALPNSMISKYCTHSLGLRK